MQAPSFSLPDQNGTIHNLSDYKGKWVVVYFYPKDDTPGCTKEACSFRDQSEELVELGVAVVGISKDTVVSHKKFETKYTLNFPILADPEHKVIEAYGAWGPKKFMGREFLGTHRNTYVINPDGEIVKEYKDVNPAGHTADVINDLHAFMKNAN
jgi:peroxiredoxin Q/BCP